jgi:hypothetical protein
MTLHGQFRKTPFSFPATVPKCNKNKPFIIKSCASAGTIIPFAVNREHRISAQQKRP